MQHNGKKHKNAFRFWIPLISLFTGARGNDLCQLRLEDIKEEDGFHYFDMNAADLNPNGERVGKTRAAKRHVPIHSLLIKLGFLNYVNQQRSGGDTMLFSGLKWDMKNGYWAQGSKWFNDSYLVRCGAKDPVKDKNILCHHSFRHTFKNTCQESGIRDDYMKKVIGHSGKKRGEGSYEHPLSIRLLSEQVVEKLDFGLDFSHLMDKRRNPYLT